MTDIVSLIERAAEEEAFFLEADRAGASGAEACMPGFCHEKIVETLRARMTHGCYDNNGKYVFGCDV